MKIKVNTTNSQKLKDKIINEILAIAKEKANLGISTFSYNIDREVRRSLPSPDLLASIEIASEGTVGIQYRGDAYTTIKFYING